jgi:hypothetical protein
MHQVPAASAFGQAQAALSSIDQFRAGSVFSVVAAELDGVNGLEIADGYAPGPGSTSTVLAFSMRAATLSSRESSSRSCRSPGERTRRRRLI